ncbi:hypothetical protein Vretimale_18328 [Volvox reticuliferus]|uniref:Uncharacterized protein n=1 Tax=Volvox reticuliferus TaxID=1737510 RepID=A0A8J4GWQ2_9CHLO|nr:hypothetical protein Vretimale_18328 [Volvox reticuliferus]
MYPCPTSTSAGSRVSTSLRSRSTMRTWLRDPEYARSYHTAGLGAAFGSAVLSSRSCVDLRVNRSPTHSDSSVSGTGTSTVSERSSKMMPSDSASSKAYDEKALPVATSCSASRARGAPRASFWPRLSFLYATGSSIGRSSISGLRDSRSSRTEPTYSSLVTSSSYKSNTMVPCRPSSSSSASKKKSWDQDKPRAGSVGESTTHGVSMKIAGRIGGNLSSVRPIVNHCSLCGPIDVVVLHLHV